MEIALPASILNQERKLAGNALLLVKPPPFQLLTCYLVINLTYNLISDYCRAHFSNF